MTPTLKNCWLYVVRVAEARVWATERDPKLLQSRNDRENVPAGKAYSRRKFLGFAGNSSKGSDIRVGTDRRKAPPCTKPRRLVYNLWLTKDAMWIVRLPEKVKNLEEKNHAEDPTLFICRDATARAI